MTLPKEVQMTLDVQHPGELSAGVQWKAVDADQIACEHDEGMPYATHEGVLDIMGHKLRCYRLNTGQTVFQADDINEFFAAGLVSNNQIQRAPQAIRWNAELDHEPFTWRAKCCSTERSQ